jgi:hypothetical protein
MISTEALAVLISLAVLVLATGLFFGLKRGVSLGTIGRIEKALGFLNLGGLRNRRIITQE